MGRSFSLLPTAPSALCEFWGDQDYVPFVGYFVCDAACADMLEPLEALATSHNWYSAVTGACVYFHFAWTFSETKAWSTWWEKIGGTSLMLSLFKLTSHTFLMTVWSKSSARNIFPNLFLLEKWVAMGWPVKSANLCDVIVNMCCVIWLIIFLVLNIC